MRRTRSVFGLFSVLLVVLLFNSALTEAADKKTITEIRVFSEAIVYNDQYKLEEIAEISSNDTKFVRKLSRIPMGRSPLPGRSYVLSSGLIKSRLGKLFRQNQIHVIMPTKAIVSRAAVKIDESQIKQLIRQQISEHYQSFSDVEIVVRSKIRDIYVPKGKTMFEIKQVGNSKNNGGYLSWSLEIFVDGKSAKRLWVRTQVTTIKKSLAAKREIKKGTIITEADLIEIKKDVSRERKGIPIKKNELIGKIARRRIYKNEPLEANLFETPLVIKEGNQVQLYFETKNLLLVNKVTALRSGRVGDIIPVKTIKSRKIIQAVIESKDRVKIAL